MVEGALRRHEEALPGGLEGGGSFGVAGERGGWGWMDGGGGSGGSGGGG